MKLDKLYRITVFVPEEEQIKNIIKSVLSIDPLDVGAYEEVFFKSSVGQEHFKQKPNSIHYKSEETSHFDLESYKVEFSIKRDETHLEKILIKIKDAHPWEEPVIQIYEVIETRFS